MTPEQWAAQAEEARIAYRSRNRKALRRVVQDNLASLIETLESGIRSGSTSLTARILVGYARTLEDLGYNSQVKGWIGQLLAGLRPDDEPQALFGLHELEYTDAFLGGATQEAAQHCERMFDIATRAQSNPLLARALTAQCRIDLRNEDAAAVETHAAALAACADLIRDDFYAAFAPHMLANLREMQGRTTEAVACYKQSSARFEKSGADHMLMVEAFNLAACSLDLGELGSARDGFRRTADLVTELDDDHLLPELLSCLAGLADAEGKAAKAARLTGAAASALDRAGRVLYPAEQKASAELRARLTDTLGAEIDAIIAEGSQLDSEQALIVGLAGC